MDRGFGIIPLLVIFAVLFFVVGARYWFATKSNVAHSEDTQRIDLPSATSNAKSSDVVKDSAGKTYRDEQFSSVSASEVVTTFCPSFTVDLSPGDVDASNPKATPYVPIGEVSNLQRFLITEGESLWSVSGIFDDETAAAVRQWKLHHGFASDSKVTASLVGPKTRSAMALAAKQKDTCAAKLQPACVLDAVFTLSGDEHVVPPMYTRTYIGPVGYESSKTPDIGAATLVHVGACTPEDAKAHNANLENDL